MRGTLRAVTTLGLLLVVGTAGLAGQTRLVMGLGGGAVLPSKGSFGDDVKSVGYHFQLMMGIAPEKGMLSFRLDGQYASVNYEQGISGARPKDKILAVHADLVLHPSSGGTVRPYLLAGPTYGRFSFRNGLTGTAGNSEVTTNFGFNGGAGLNIGNAGKVWFFTEARYVYTKEHKYIPITIGIRINTGQPYTSK